MKFLQNPTLEAYNSALSTDHGDHSVSCRLESYSCKMAGEDKRFFKTFANDGNLKDLAMLSPPQTLTCGSPSTSFSSVEENDSLNSVCERKTLYYLISTLNAAFEPDYDFSDAKSEEFSREPSPDFAKNFINNSLKAAIGEYYDRFSAELWLSINQEIDLEECTVYSYNPDLVSDPFGDEGSLCSFCFFFYNRILKRVLLFTSKTKSQSTVESCDFEEFDLVDDIDGDIERQIPLLL